MDTPITLRLLHLPAFFLLLDTKVSITLHFLWLRYLFSIPLSLIGFYSFLHILSESLNEPLNSISLNMNECLEPFPKLVNAPKSVLNQNITWQAIQARLLYSE